MNWFVNYIYREANAKLGTSFEPGQNPSVDSLATKIALQTGINNGIAPTSILSFLNQGLGTNFTMADYNRAATEFGFPTTAEEPPPAAVTVEAPPPVAAAPETQVTAPTVTEEPAADTSTNLFSNIEANPFIETEPVKTDISQIEKKSVNLPEGFNTLSPREKAGLYNDLLSQGFGEDQIRTAVEAKLGKQSNADWGALKDIASVVKTTGQIDKGGAFTTNFGDENSWQFGKGAEYNEKNMIESSGAYFQRGNDVIVSDELFWNPDSPTGEKLAKKISGTQGEGKRAGVVITPYAVFQNKATNQQLLDEVKRSGADFVAIDPYVGFGVPKEQLLAWTKEFVPKLNELGVGVKLVLQDFSKTGMENETKAYNNELLQTPGISEFISFGLEDAKDLQGSPEWTSLSGGKQFQTQQEIKQQAPETTTTEQTTLTGGLLGGTAAPDTGFKIQDYIKEATDFLNSPENLQLAEGAATMQQVTLPDGRTLNVYSDGLAQEFTSDGRVKVYNQSGEEVLNQTQEEYKRAGYLSPVVNALMAAAGGAVLGPAGAGLLTTPAAAAAATGGTTLVRGGSVEDALKAAALAGLTAGATEGLLGGGGGGTAVVDDLVAADVAQLASQGVSESQIAQILTQEGVSSKAINAALDATFGVSAPGSAKGLDFPATTTGAEQVPVTGAGTGLLSSGAAAPLGSGLSTLVDTTPAVTEQVPVTGQNLPQTKVTLDDLLSVLTSGVTGALPAVTGGETQQVGITEQKPQTTVQDVVPAVTAGITAGTPPTTVETQRVETTGKTEKPDTTVENIISSLVPAVIPATVQPPVTTPPSTAETQRVETTAQKETSLLPTLGSAVTGALPGLPTGITAELPKPIQPTEKSLFTPSDILKMLNLIGGLAAGGAAARGAGTGFGVGTLPPSDTMLGSTTPQFGPDYYAAVQRYYNAYMPQTPRDVATPLQQWYENKFGA